MNSKAVILSLVLFMMFTGPSWATQPPKTSNLKTAIQVCKRTFLHCSASTYPRLTRQPPASIRGKWVVRRAMWEGMRAMPIGTYLGLPVEYSSQVMHFGKLVQVRNPLYLIRRLTWNDFFVGFGGTDMNKLGILGESYTSIIVLNHQGKDIAYPGTILYIRNRNQIITFWDGVFYLLTRRVYGSSSNRELENWGQFSYCNIPIIEVD